MALIVIPSLRRHSVFIETTQQAALDVTDVNAYLLSDTPPATPGTYNIYVCGYFDNIIGFLEHSVSQRFLKKAHQEMIMFDANPDGLLEQFESYRAPIEPKWISTN